MVVVKKEEHSSNIKFIKSITTLNLNDRKWSKQLFYKFLTYTLIDYINLTE